MSAELARSSAPTGGQREKAGPRPAVAEILGCIPAEVRDSAQGDPVARISESPEGTARRLKVAYIGMLSTMLVVVVTVGLVKFIATGQMPGTLVLLVWALGSTVVGLFPPWRGDRPGSMPSDAQRNSEW